MPAPTRGAEPRHRRLAAIAHSEKEEAAGNDKGGFGFHPLLCYLAETGEPLDAVLRPATPPPTPPPITSRCCNSPSSSCPEADLDREILARTDIGGRTHAFTSDCRSAGIRFSVGYEVDEAGARSDLELPGSAWRGAIDGDGNEREGAEVTELTDASTLDLARGHPPDRPPRAPPPGRPALGLRLRDGLPPHRLHHRPETMPTSPPWSCATAAAPASRTRSASARRPGCAMPFAAFEHNQAWLEVSLLAQGDAALGGAALPGGRARARRAQAGAPAPAARRRAHRALGQAGGAAAAALLAVGEALVAASRLRALPGCEIIAAQSSLSFDPSPHLPISACSRTGPARIVGRSRPRKERQGRFHRNALALLPTSSRPITPDG